MTLDRDKAERLAGEMVPLCIGRLGTGPDFEGEMLRRQIARALQTQHAAGVREGMEAAAKIAGIWRTKAQASREEADRIHRTIKKFPPACERCIVRAEVWERCANEIAAILAAISKE